jgi:hypothetical protein
LIRFEALQSGDSAISDSVPAVMYKWNVAICFDRVSGSTSLEMTLEEGSDQVSMEVEVAKSSERDEVWHKA